MKKTIFISFILFMSLTSFGVHKFYVSIYQINDAPEKKMLQITSRVFIDDLNQSLSHYFKQKTHIGEVNETPEDVMAMKKYFSEYFFIKINGQKKTINYLSKELEGNVVICYFNIKEISKIKTLEVQNTMMFDLNSEQQNIIQTKINGQKQSLLLTGENNSGILKY